MVSIFCIVARIAHVLSAISTRHAWNRTASERPGRPRGPRRAQGGTDDRARPDGGRKRGAARAPLRAQRGEPAHQREPRPRDRAHRGGGERPGAHRRPLRRHRHHRRGRRGAPAIRPQPLARPRSARPPVPSRSSPSPIAPASGNAGTGAGSPVGVPVTAVPGGRAEMSMPSAASGEPLGDSYGRRADRTSLIAPAPARPSARSSCPSSGRAGTGSGSGSGTSTRT